MLNNCLLRDIISNCVSIKVPPPVTLKNLINLQEDSATEGRMNDTGVAWIFLSLVHFMNSKGVITDIDLFLVLRYRQYFTLTKHTGGTTGFKVV